MKMLKMKRGGLFELIGGLVVLVFVIGMFGGVEAQFGPLPVNCPQHPDPVPLPNPLPSVLTDVFSDLEDYITAFMEETGVSGTSAAIVYDQEIVWSGGFGYKNKNTPSQGNATIDTMYRVGSITKVFTVLMLLQLRDEGKLCLDDPVNKYWPEFNVTSPYRNNEGITFRELATQLSGLFTGSPCSYITGCNITTEEAFQLISSEEVIFPTDSYPHYSDLAFAIIGRALEPLAGMTWEEWVQQNLFAPLNMTNTGNTYTNAIQSEIAQSFINGSSIPLFVGLLNMGWASPTGQAYSTVRDLSQFLMMYFRNSDPGQSEPIVWRSSLREQTLPVWVNDDLYSGFSMPFENFYANNSQTWFHTKGGLFPGYTTFIGFHPTFKVGFVVQQNDLFAAYIGQTKMDEILFAFEQAFTPLQPGPPNPGNLTAYVGVYQARIEFIPFSFNITVSPAGNSLLSTGGFGGLTELVWYGGNTFQNAPTGPTPCINLEIGEYSEFMFFQTDSSGAVASLTTPGSDGFYGQIFKKIS